MNDSDRVSTALLLAAGTGTRLQPLTFDAPKCLTEVNGTPILERLIYNLRVQKIKRLVVVIGYLGDQIKAFLQQYAADMQIEYIDNPVYRTTNNIYSLWLAREHIRNSPFLLVESDLVFEASMLDELLVPNKIALSKILPWMNGTTVELDSTSRVTAFRKGGEVVSGVPQYKTVNIYSLSPQSWIVVEERLRLYIESGRLSDYYEAIFTELVAEGSLDFGAVFFKKNRWYEVDTQADLVEAEKLYDSPRVVNTEAHAVNDPLIVVNG
ncbi:MAG: phosphocholine cytidylyltransferase family protein [Gammaproteobacteria bacterium]|nr:phosphocholine cytidylyltransferase family protein [Gammaproteobacteria bacterium]